MIKEVMPNIFQLKIPLPGNPLKVLNSYLIKGKERSPLVDNGFNWPELKHSIFISILIDLIQTYIKGKKRPCRILILTSMRISP